MLYVICHNKDYAICMYLGGRKYPDGRDTWNDLYKVDDVDQWEAINPTQYKEWSKSLLAGHIEELLTAAYTGEEYENKLYTLF